MPGPADRNLNPDHDPSPGPAPDAEAGAITTPNTGGDLVLVKNGQRYVFKCQPGGEKQLLNQLAEMADDPSNDITWFDAAVLSHQMGQTLGQTIEGLQKAS